MNQAGNNSVINRQPYALNEAEAQHQSTTQAFLKRHFDLFLFALLISAFTFIAAQGLDRVPVPETDESYTLQVAYEVVHHGKIALPMYRYLGGNIENNWHSYTPVYFVLLGGFLKTFGWGIVQGRAFNLLTAILTLLMMYLIARRLFDWRAAMIAALMLISDQTFLGRARLLRNDYAAAFFALLAFYLFEMAEEKRRHWLYAVSGLAAGAGVMCHTNVLYMIGAIGLLMLLKDGWRVLKNKKLYLFAVSALAMMAYEIFAILVDRENFIAQNRADKLHFQVLEGGWLQNIWREKKRYLLWYAGGELFLNVPRTLLHIFQLLTVMALVYFSVRFLLGVKKRDCMSDCRSHVFIVTVIVIVFLAVLGGNKDIYYLAHLAPWFAICVGVMLNDAWRTILRLQAGKSASGRKWLARSGYWIGIGVLGFACLLFSFTFLRQQRRYLREVRNPELASFDEIKIALRDAVPEGLCPVAMKAPEMWLAFPEYDDCFATIEERTKQQFEEDSRDYALIMANASQRARHRWTAEFDEKYHLLGELKNTAYGDIKIYYTGKDERYLRLPIKQIQFFGDHRGYDRENPVPRVKPDS